MHKKYTQIKLVYLDQLKEKIIFIVVSGFPKHKLMQRDRGKMNDIKGIVLMIFSDIATELYFSFCRSVQLYRFRKFIEM